MERSAELSMDQTFLQKLTNAVFANLNNEQFSAEDLAKEVGLSQSQIHRKLNKINGKSITQFIREIRLEEAHRLLEKEIGTAAEIAYQVGFGSPTYFNTCFYEFFGYTPSDVTNKKKETLQYNKPSGEEDTTIIPIHGKELEIAKENRQEADDKGRRRHAAIMFTDIVGYTALMGSNEDRAIEVLHKNREIHAELIEKYNGNLIKEMGDGMLVSFNLASDAVRSAIEIQNACKKQAIPLKIGIHEGEMVFSGSDVLGDGVNIASRLQEDSQKGCITISGSVYRDIKNKPTIKTEFVKEKRFKNVDEPIKVYQVIYEEEAISNDNNKISYDSQPGKIGNINYRTKKFLLATTFVLILFFILTAIWYSDRRSKIEWAKGPALIEIEQHLNADNRSDAYQVALKAEKYNSRDPKLINLMSLASSYISIVTDPPGADIYAKAYKKPESEWEFLGNSPIESVRLPRIFFRWKMEKEGYETIDAVSTTRIDTLYRKLDGKGILPP